MGKRYLLISLFIVVCKGSLFASHIVGGEFELLHKSGDRYRLNMIMYFDAKNGQPGAMDPTVIAYIYKKSNNQYVRSVTLARTEILDVPYTNPSCNSTILETLKILYTAEITLEKDTYKDAGGYYISFERCCRNYGITNIFSNNPATGGISAGQTFYLEFPPVVDANGDPFINSTPRLFPPLKDYGCVGKRFYTDFSGVDDDGDSLVYKIVNPYSTFDTENALPINPSPGPYPEVVWRTGDGFGPNSIIQGDPDISITQDGLLSGRPTLEGLFVFAVQCEEYRDGKRIGVMRRDFQLLVVDGCVNEDPEVKARALGSSVIYQEGQVLDFDYANPDKCVDILVQDLPVGGDDVENVNIRVIPINFKASLDGIFIDDSQNIPISSGDDVAVFRVCFPDCPYLANTPYQIGIIAMDDNCPQPALDTVIVSVRVHPPPNEPPRFRDLGSELTINVDEMADGFYQRDITGTDQDFQPLILKVLPDGFELSDYGMSFETVEQANGRITTRFSWNYDCQTVSFADRSDFDIKLTLEDVDACNLPDPSELTLHLHLNLPPNTAPDIYASTASPEQSYLQLKYSLNTPISLKILGYDADNDLVSMTAQAMNFNMNTFSAGFPPVEGRGLDRPSSVFTMNLPCDYNLSVQDSFRVAFFIEDYDKCQLINRDTLLVDFLIEPPVASPPQLSMRSLTAATLETGNKLSVPVGEPVRVRVQGVDFDHDEMHLRLVDYDPALEGLFTFSETTGSNRIESDLVWDTDCAVLPPAIFEKTFSFTFRVDDNNCYEQMSDEIVLEMTLNDIVQDRESFIPPNIFTPNHVDNYNPVFMLEGTRADNGMVIDTGLPLDNCKSEFKQIVIYNRWGSEVFSSDKRDFQWDGDGVSPGVYFYIIQYSDFEMKGTVTVRY